MGFAGGVVVLELVLALVGYAFVRPFVGPSSMRTHLSYVGVAIVAGNGACAALATVVAVAGVRTTIGVMAIVAVVAAAIGLGVGAIVRRRLAPYPATERPPATRGEEIVSLAAAAILCAIAAGILYGGFRSTPWLDDSWFFWVPKGLVLEKLGLDTRLFVPNGHYATLTSPDYPLGWSVLLGTGVRLAGKVDLRVVNAELATLTVAFLATAARLLWSLVRPVFALAALALLAASPEFERQALGGGADLTVAYFVVLFALAAAAWIAHGDPLALVLAAVFAAGGLATKNEAAPELLAIVVVLVLAAWRRARRRLPALAIAFAVAVATAVPWFVWRQVHGVQDEISISRGLDPGYLAGRTSRLGPTWTALSTHLFDVRSWLVILPLLLILTVGLLLRERRLLSLAPLGAVAAVTAILVWVYWADPLDLNYKLGTSSYRSVDTVTLFAALACAPLTDRMLRRR